MRSMLSVATRSLAKGRRRKRSISEQIYYMNQPVQFKASAYPLKRVYSIISDCKGAGSIGGNNIDVAY